MYTSQEHANYQYKYETCRINISEKYKHNQCISHRNMQVLSIRIIILVKNIQTQSTYKSQEHANSQYKYETCPNIISKKHTNTIDVLVTGTCKFAECE